MFQPEYTMYGYVVHDQSNVNGSVHSRVLRTLLTQNLKNLMPSFHLIMENALVDEIGKGDVLSSGGFTSDRDDCISVPQQEITFSYAREQSSSNLCCCKTPGDSD